MAASASDHETALTVLRRDAQDLFRSAVDACSMDRVLSRHVSCLGDELHVQPPAWWDAPPVSLPLGGFRSVLLIAIGKAAVPLTEGLLRILPQTLPVRGLCAAPERPTTRPRRNRCQHIAWFAGGHPVPNRHSFRAASTALRLLEQADEHTLVLFLISGGGSSLFELPLDPAITLADTIAFHRTLVQSGAAIAEINTLRKHFSAVKGGRLAVAARSATSLTLSVLDVPLSQLDALASGPTVGDSTTVADCREVLERHALLPQFSPSVRAFFARPDLPETPGRKNDGTSFQGADGWPFGRQISMPLVANEDLLAAARRRALQLGYEVRIETGCDDWPYNRAALFLVERFAAWRRERPNANLCLLSGGEVTVAIDRTPGTGGRNQQFAVAAGLLLEKYFSSETVVCLSAGSDGVDGNSVAAGGIVVPVTMSRARSLGLSPEQALADFDTHRLLSAVESVVQSKATRNNVRDLRVLMSLATHSLSA